MIQMQVQVTGIYSIAADQPIDNEYIINILNSALKNTASDLLYKIVKATNNGKDAYNKPFLPYSKGYLNKRLKSGLGTVPNLQLTSDMIKSLTVREESKTKVVIEVQGMGSEGLTNNQKLFYIQNDPKAPRIMLASSPYYKKYVQNRLNYHIKKQLNKK